MTSSQAIQYIRGQLALNDTPSTWSYEDRVRYNKALAEFQMANPGVFPNGIPAVIENIAGKQYQPLEDDSFSFSMFGDEVLNNAKEASFSLFGSLRNALYIATVVLVAIYAYSKFAKK
jgi:hypothetical protein